MKRGLLSFTIAGAMCSAASMAFAGAYGTPEQPTEGPVSAPPVARERITQEEESERVLRKFAGFLTDSETSRGFWAELGSMYYAGDGGGVDYDGAYTFLHLSYGQEMWEAGILAPYHYDHAELPGNDFDEHGFGDLKAWGKIVPLRTEYFNLGTGLVMSFPTADHDIISENEYGFLPFVTMGGIAGPVHIRGSLGYSRYTDSPDSDALDYNAAVLVPIGDMIVVRGELVGQHYFDFNVGEDPLTFVPGIDVIIPMGGVELLVRPTGGVALTSDTFEEWSLGLSIAVAQI